MGDHGEVSHFKTTRKGITASFGPEERAFLADVLPLLAGIGEVGWEIRSVAGTTAGGRLFSGNIGTVLRADTGVDSWGWDLVDYTIDIADIDLTVGSYFLGVKANDADDVHLTLLYDPVNITGALLKSTGPGYETYHTGKDYAFRLDGIATAPVPEPSTIALLGIGLVGLAGGAVRRR